MNKLQKPPFRSDVVGYYLRLDYLSQAPAKKLASILILR